MPKYSGKIGYVIDHPKPNDETVFVKEVFEQQIVGELLNNTSRTDNSGTVNGELRLSQRISFVANPWAFTNYSSIKYATYMGIKWEVSSVEVLYPRLVLSLGGVYNCDPERVRSIT